MDHVVKMGESAESFQALVHLVDKDIRSLRRRGQEMLWRLIFSGVLQLAFGGPALIPVVFLSPIPLTIVCCACLAFTGILGFLSACVCSTKTLSSVLLDGGAGQQRALFPRFYFFLVFVGFCLAVATAVWGIVIVFDGDHWYHNGVMGGVGVGVGVFLALNQMLIISIIAPLLLFYLTDIVL
ncbi:hypothetical protein BV898_19702 [Hypsibius exemplaris]|uniref:Uncharacterized protein n=1 Tax=Hypsibius exemplaris TaxID=2072580 RepID=A0A9X6NLD4_HYPEX|nr:hypothetical protein BV898_19702 [Hypsibius exemplaris]